MSEPINSVEQCQSILATMKERLKIAVQGRDDVIDLVLVALFGDGHVLLEDYPGSGKTTLAKALGECLCEDDTGGIPHFKRIQFTPDLLPSDVTGAMIFDAESNSFHFQRGPIFSRIVLADEINRTSPKVQAALLEAMAEKQVTVENTTYPLDPLFYVIATQNPLDLIGTYPLPAAQLDRFLFKIIMSQLDRDSELAVVERWKSARMAPGHKKIHPQDILSARHWIRENIVIAPIVMTTLVDYFQAIRKDARVILGPSTRAIILALPALQTLAVMRGRNYIAPEDLQHILVPLLNHRIQFKGGIDKPRQVIVEIFKPFAEKLARETLKP